MKEKVVKLMMAITMMALSIIGKTTRYPRRKTKRTIWKNEAYSFMCDYTPRFLCVWH